MNIITSNHHQHLEDEGLIPFQFHLPESWKELTLNRDFDRLYQEVQEKLSEQGELWHQIDDKISSIYDSVQSWSYEWMLALREGPQDEDQEGIWHDDSSRDLALSLSLNLRPDLIKGGELRLRPYKQRELVTVVTARAWGEAHIFATGKWGWEHKTSRVTSGNRLVLVVWITKTSN